MHICNLYPHHPTLTHIQYYTMMQVTVLHARGIDSEYNGDGMLEMVGKVMYAMDGLFEDCSSQRFSLTMLFCKLGSMLGLVLNSPHVKVFH